MFVQMDRLAQASSFVLLGEAGCGKTELAVNLAVRLLPFGRPVHLFDLDMTKPLFRTRELAETLVRSGVHVHFENQYADAPTTGGWVRSSLRDTDRFTILDVGGDHIGARAIGAYAPLLNRENTAIFYLVNPFRPWSDNVDHAAGVLSQILAASHLQAEKIRFVGNPNFGAGTTLKDVLDGCSLLNDMLERIAFVCVEESVSAQASEILPLPVFPIKRQIEYP